MLLARQRERCASRRRRRIQPWLTRFSLAAWSQISHRSEVCRGSRSSTLRPASLALGMPTKAPNPASLIDRLSTDFALAPLGTNPRGVEVGTGSRPADHVSDLQVLDDHHVATGDHRASGLVVEVPALAGRSSLLGGKDPLGTLLARPCPAWFADVIFMSAVAGGGEAVATPTTVPVAGSGRAGTPSRDGTGYHLSRSISIVFTRPSGFQRHPSPSFGHSPLSKRCSAFALGYPGRAARAPGSRARAAAPRPDRRWRQARHRAGRSAFATPPCPPSPASSARQGRCRSRPGCPRS